jgi:catechol 2,3-dioxygenase-like lactoylglutathione lyase family enzyme
MLDHVFIAVSDIKRAAGHPDLKGFGAHGRVFFWLRAGAVAGRAVHVGFIANGQREVDAAFAAAMAAGATEIHAPGPQLHYDPRYYAAQVRDPDGYSLEFVFKKWQH